MSFESRILYARHSLRSPFYTIREQTLPFWDFGGSTAVYDSYVRLTPKLRNRSGWIWNTQPLTLSSWQIDLMFQINAGIPGQPAGEGMAIWVTENRLKPGDVFGSDRVWKGLGVFLDSFDNNGNGDNPRITAIWNEGFRQFQTEYDNIDREKIDNGCVYNYRGNTKQYLRITYEKPTAKLSIETSTSGISYSLCTSFKVPQMHGYLIGFSASTGQQSDNHDIYHLSTYGIADPPTPSPSETLENDEPKTHHVKQQKPLQKQIVPQIGLFSQDQFTTQYAHVLDKLKKFKERKHQDHATDSLEMVGGDAPSLQSPEAILTPQHLFQELFVQLRYLRQQQTMIAGWLETIRATIRQEKKELHEEHHRFANDFERLIRHLASRTQLLNLFSEQDALLKERETAQIRSLEVELTTLKGDLEQVSIHIHRNILDFGANLKKIKNTMDISHSELARYGAEVKDDQQEHHQLIKSSTALPLTVYIMAVQSVITIIFLIILRSRDVREENSFLSE